MGLLRAGHGRSFRPAAARTRARASLPHLGLPRRSGDLRDLGGAFSCQHVCGAALRSAVVPCADGQWRPGVPSLATPAPQVVELTSQPFLDVQCTRRASQVERCAERQVLPISRRAKASRRNHVRNGHDHVIDALYGLLILVLLAIAFVVWASFYSIGPTQVGLVRKRFGKKLPGDNPIAFHGEAGYQAELLMPGLRFRFLPIYAVTKHPWVQVPAGQIGLVIAQVGEPLPIGAKSAVYTTGFGNFTNLEAFVDGVAGPDGKKIKGQKGVQRPVLAPGTLAPIHPVAFLVITKPQVYGIPVSEELRRHIKGRTLTFASFSLEEKQLEVTRIEPRATESGHVVDMVGVVTALDGEPLPAGDIASRLGGFKDIEDLEKQSKAGGEGGAPVANPQLIETILGSKNDQHKSYQDFQAFLDKGGKIGLQHDPLLYGAYNLNPFLVQVEQVPMLVVEQGQVAVIKSYVGLPTEDTSSAEFKFGSLVKPGHRGIWEEPLRTGKYPINPRIYQAEIVPTSILKLDWSQGVTGAHGLDARLEPIVAKSREGFIFTLDLQVLIHVPDTKAPR